jgi:hypothetical protein
MILSSTQITVEPHSVLFVNHSNHGAQMVRVTMALREPTIFASSVTIEDGHRMVFTPLALTEQECVEFFRKADEMWVKKERNV